MDVNWRLFFVIVWLMVAGVLNGYFLNKEEIARKEESKKHLVLNQDPLLELRYIKANRKVNFEAFGLDDAEVTATLKIAQKKEDLHAARIEILLRQAGDPDAVADALCGETQGVRPRYGALRYLVSEDRGRRQSVNLRKISAIEEQEWAALAPIGAVYTELELSNERQPDATRMAIAAILLGKEQEVLDHNAPWGQGIAGLWSWSRVKKENAGVSDLVLDYFAQLHVVTEIAQDEGGICDG
ncbi:MAG: hypothetical protein H6739_13495 [Alphaproteobacteria bacterium]|nr:hypothetical protein [Alphaproteobacteria bacterium]